MVCREDFEQKETLIANFFVSLLSHKYLPYVKITKLEDSQAHNPGERGREGEMQGWYGEVVWAVEEHLGN